jgi:hypothetical protein
MQIESAASDIALARHSTGSSDSSAASPPRVYLIRTAAAWAWNRPHTAHFKRQEKKATWEQSLEIKHSDKKSLSLSLFNAFWKPAASEREETETAPPLLMGWHLIHFCLPSIAQGTRFQIASAAQGFNVLWAQRVIWLASTHEAL